MERIFDTFREASQEAARICREHGIGASLERRESQWVVVFDQELITEAPPPIEPDPLALENDLLRTELRQAKYDCSRLERQNKDLCSRISLLEQEHALVKPLLVRDAPSPFTLSVLDKTPKENVETILRYEYLCILNDLSEIDNAAFNEFRVASGLWIAIHNFEKIKNGPQPVHIPDRPRPNVEHCSSCGGIVINGHCRCSN